MLNNKFFILSKIYSSAGQGPWMMSQKVWSHSVLCDLISKTLPTSPLIFKKIKVIEHFGP